MVYLISTRCILSVIIGILVISCSKDKNIHYLFPHRIDSISGDRSNITTINYKIKSFNSTGNEKPSIDSILIFSKDGHIFNSTKKIGDWNKDGTLYLDQFKKRFFFNWITPGNCNTLQLHTQFRIGNDNDLHEIKIVAGNTAVQNHHNNNNGDEFSF